MHNWVWMEHAVYLFTYILLFIVHSNVRQAFSDPSAGEKHARGTEDSGKKVEGTGQKVESWDLGINRLQVWTDSTPAIHLLRTSAGSEVRISALAPSRHIPVHLPHLLPHTPLLCAWISSGRKWGTQRAAPEVAEVNAWGQVCEVTDFQYFVMRSSNIQQTERTFR